MNSSCFAAKGTSEELALGWWDRCQQLWWALRRLRPPPTPRPLTPLRGHCGAGSDHAGWLLLPPADGGSCRYVQHYGLDGACDDVVTVLKRVAVRLGKAQKVKVLTGTGNVTVVQPDYSAAAHDFLRTFRRGLLGPVMLDRDGLQSPLDS